MKNKIKQEMNRIEIPSNIHQRAVLGVKKAKTERKKNKSIIKIITVAASLVFLSVGGFSYHHYRNTTNSPPQTSPSIDGQSFDDQSINGQSDKDESNNDQSIGGQSFDDQTINSGVVIPEIELPEQGTAKMMPLIVYNEKIYTQSATTIHNNRASEIKGEKLGMTKAGIDEWSKQDKYAEEFASTIGEIDVYSVKGYQKDFRIMTYYELNGEVFADFYESLSGITINDGSDIFGKLHLMNNLEEAKFRSYEDALNHTNNFKKIENIEVVHTFLEELNKAKPYSVQDVEAKLGDFRNNDQYKELNLHLTDGTNVTLGVIKEGYISYGQSLYFKINEEVFVELWNL
ncbi:hypothetical protein [Sutcliffiella halmapala]|uniref:hypothetical protein n=1 Tax=Sutcliffiella halmapala TaxID=79882 RepID=UPI0009957DE2|nr:hypothetical protein [Sutcliffiella halmapala]